MIWLSITKFIDNPKKIEDGVLTSLSEYTRWFLSSNWVAQSVYYYKTKVDWIVNIFWDSLLTELISDFCNKNQTNFTLSIQI